MSQVAGNYDNQGRPLPSVEVKPVQAAPSEELKKKRGILDVLGFDTFANDLYATQSSVKRTEGGASAGFNFSELMSTGEQKNSTNALLTQLFVVVGCVVLLLFAFKLFKK